MAANGDLSTSQTTWNQLKRHQVVQLRPPRRQETSAASRKWIKHLSSRVSAALRYRSSFFYEWPARWAALVLRSEPPRTRWRERRHLCEENAEPCALWGGGSRTWKFKTVQQAAAARCRGSLPFCTLYSDKDEKAENPEAVNRVPKHNPLSVEVKVKEIHV